MTLAIKRVPGARHRGAKKAPCGAGRATNQPHQTRGCLSLLALYHWGRYGALRRAVTLTRLVQHHGNNERRSGAFLPRSTNENAACAGNDSRKEPCVRTASRQAGKGRCAGVGPVTRELGGGAGSDRGDGCTAARPSPPPRKRRRRCAT